MSSFKSDLEAIREQIRATLRQHEAQLQRLEDILEHHLDGTPLRTIGQAAPKRVPVPRGFDDSDDPLAKRAFDRAADSDSLKAVAQAIGKQT